MKTQLCFRWAPSPADRRSTIIRLTAGGDALFRKVFPEQVAQLKPYFEKALTPDDMETLRGLLLKLRDSFEQDASAGA